MMSQDSVLAGGLSFKKAESYYYRPSQKTLDDEPYFSLFSDSLSLALVKRTSRRIHRSPFIHTFNYILYFALHFSYFLEKTAIHHNFESSGRLDSRGREGNCCSFMPLFVFHFLPQFSRINLLAKISVTQPKVRESVSFLYSSMHRQFGLPRFA